MLYVLENMENHGAMQLDGEDWCEVFWGEKDTLGGEKKNLSHGDSSRYMVWHKGL